jgi:ribonuclease-3
VTLRDDGLADLEERLGRRFTDRALLDRALTHASYAHESGNRAAAHNEALEFLGDAVLGFLVADLLHRLDPEGEEGQKSRLRAAVVSRQSLARRAEALGLPSLLRLGRGEEKSGGRSRAALWANAYEAVLAALYLDGGIEPARDLVSRHFEEELGRGIAELDRDYKSALQEYLQSQGRQAPVYRVVAEEGPSHQRTFRIACVVADAIVGEADGRSKKEAQQLAARRALEALRR